MFESWMQDHFRRMTSDIKVRVDKRRRDFAESPKGFFKLIQDPAFQLLWDYLKPRLPSVLVVSLLGVLRTAVETVRVVVLMLTLGLIVGDTSLASRAFGFFGVNLSASFVSDLLTRKDGLVWGLVTLILLTTTKETVSWLADHLVRKFQMAFTLEVRRDVTDKMLNLESRYFADNKSGDIAYLQTGLVQRFQTLLTTAQTFFTTSLDLLVALVFLALLSGWLVLMLGVLALGMLLAVGRMEQLLKLRSFDAEEASRRAGTYFLEMIYGIRLVRQAGQEARARKGYLELAWDREAKYMRLQDYSALGQGATRFAGVIALLLAAFAANMLSGLNLLENVGLGLAYLYLAMRILGNMTALQGARFRMAIMIPQFMMVAEFLQDQTYSEKEYASARPALVSIEKDISVESLSFRYQAQRNVLDNISLQFPKGSITALVGLSGSGKTTLLELLAGFRTLQEGQIIADGHSIAEYTKASYRQKVGYVAQETIVFHDTLLENVRFLRPEATQEEIDRAVAMACARDFILEAERGYDTIVGERGSKISGGQRQRISLARVLLQDPQVLLLDEATSSLDLLTESQFYENLMRIKDGKIIIVAAHRLSAIAHFDNIIIIHEGKIVEQGTHPELLTSKGLYYHLYSLQEYVPNI
jgi:ABC-type bacteriocin/lantibiotic exporter with double-glycine peptidase domain